MGFWFWQCRERYHNQQELLENAAEYRKRGIPVDNIVQDWNYWPEKTWGPEWNRELYPKPEQMCKSLNDMNFHFMASVWPWLNNKSLEDTYGLKEFKIDDTNNLDFFNSDLRSRYYQMLNDSMFTMGVNSIWLDGTEPESFPKGTTAMGDINHNALAYSYLVPALFMKGREKIIRIRESLTLPVPDLLDNNVMGLQFGRVMHLPVGSSLPNRSRPD